MYNKVKSKDFAFMKKIQSHYLSLWYGLFSAAKLVNSGITIYQNLTIIHKVITLWRISTVTGETKGKRNLKVTQIIARQKKVRQRVS